MQNKKSKSSKMRGRTTHGYGSMKKNRGAGHRGGKGNAGTGKRADQKKPTILKEYGGSYFGKRGFNTPVAVKTHYHCINLETLQRDLDQYVEKKIVVKKGDVYEVDVTKLGYNKILGKGKLNVKLKVNSPMISRIAAEKIEAAGGEIVGVKEEGAKIDVTA